MYWSNPTLFLLMGILLTSLILVVGSKVLGHWNLKLFNPIKFDPDFELDVHKFFTVIKEGDNEHITCYLVMNKTGASAHRMGQMVALAIQDFNHLSPKQIFIHDRKKVSWDNMLVLTFVPGVTRWTAIKEQYKEIEKNELPFI